MERSFDRWQNRSGVLVLTLLVLVLISVIVLGLLASVTMERQSTMANYQQRRALSLAMLGFQTGVQQLRDALGTGTNSWDNPFGNFITNAPGFYWSVSPGILSRWTYTNATPVNYPLYSHTSDANNSNLVDLNRPLADGSYPIIGLSDAGGAATAPTVDVQFVNVLQDPTQEPSRTNQIVGRYAFWIDDESAKINVNVADGSRTKYSADWMTNSLGLGSPTEVSLTALPQGGSGSYCSQVTASNIVAIARGAGFHSPREILKAGGASGDLYTNNVFDLTDDSRSPDINVFGQPKMAILPMLGDLSSYQYNMVINGISLLPENEIYPTPSQLTGVWVGNYADSPTRWTSVPWPLAFRSQLTQAAMGDYYGLGNDGSVYGQVLCYPYSNGSVIASYLAGWNSFGVPITWPVFPIDSSTATATNGFAGKYSYRQLDEIAIQIVNIGSKLISSDYPGVDQNDYPSAVTLPNGQTMNFPAVNVLTNGITEASLDYGMTGYGSSFSAHYNDAAYLWPGWLSHQWVMGIGRTPKVTRLAMSVQSFGSVGTPAPLTNNTYTPPYAYVNIWLEEWIPSGFRGGNQAALYQNSWVLGAYQYPGYINLGDVDDTEGGGTPGWLRTPVSYGATWWGGRLLTNNQGIDLACNTITDDPQPDQAAEWHNPWALWQDGGSGTPVYHSSEYWTYGGGSSGQDGNRGVQGQITPYYMNELENDGGGQLEWPAGTMRNAQTTEGLGPDGDPDDAAPTKLFMQSGADGQPLIFTGGFQVIGNASDQADGLGMESDPDPTPLEGKRGLDYAYNGFYTDDNECDTAWTNTDGLPGSPPGTTLAGRNLASVISVGAITNMVPAGSATGPANVGPVSYRYMTCTDPLVNKFPGDWTNAATAPAHFFDLGASTDGGQPYASYPDGDYTNTLADPDCYWLPQMDGQYCYVTGAPTFARLLTTTLIPRSARMPSVGYLQYVRTGIMPDDETNTAYTNQHGTPFRLLSYAPLNDTTVPNSQRTTLSTSKAYPDWAMLDLFYVPSILYSFGGPYAGQTNLASFGTYGGSTAGRINPNGAVIYTTNVNTPRPDITRLIPLEATFNGLMVDQHSTGSAATAYLWGYSGGSVVDAPTVAGAVAAYLHNNGPLRMPGEICNITALGAAPYRSAENPTGSRNDLVRQMVGELTTQSNVYSVWTVGQVIQKLASNQGYGEFEPGDQVVGEVRLHLIVERYLDPGADGVYGNNKNAGWDGVVGSFDDPQDAANHPPNPKYLYRVVRAEEVR